MMSRKHAEWLIWQIARLHTYIQKVIKPSLHEGSSNPMYLLVGRKIVDNDFVRPNSHKASIPIVQIVEEMNLTSRDDGNLLRKGGEGRPPRTRDMAERRAEGIVESLLDLSVQVQSARCLAVLTCANLANRSASSTPMTLLIVMLLASMIDYVT